MRAILISILMLSICHHAFTNAVPAPGDTGCGNNYNPAAPSVHIYNSYGNNCPAVEKPTPPIPSDYVVYQGLGAYKLQSTGLTWNDARQACLKEGAHLAIITSLAEEAIFQQMHRAKNVQCVWLGFHSQFKKDNWVSVFDQELSTIGYTHWHVGEPNNAGGNERCVCSTDNGMNDLDCVSKLAFFCKIDLRQ